MSGLSGFIWTSLWPLSVNKTLPGPFQTRHSACDFYSFLTHFDPSEITRSILLWVAEMTSAGRQRSWGHVAIVSTRWILWEASNSAQRQSGWRACAGCDGHVESPDDHRTNPAELKVLGPWSVSSLFCEYTNINLGHFFFYFLKSYKSNWSLISYTNTAINAAHSLKQSFSKYIKVYLRFSELQPSGCGWPEGAGGI